MTALSFSGLRYRNNFVTAVSQGCNIPVMCQALRIGLHWQVYVIHIIQ